MKIIVPIKQVPETGDVKLDENTGVMIRDGVESVINPLDLYAIETALRLREQHGGEVVVLSMGPPAASTAIKEAIAMGCDRGMLLSDRQFAGADTLATAYVLSRAISQEGGFDLVICGERATDGDTGQVGPGIGSFLGLPVATFVNRIEVDADRVRVDRLVEGGTEHLEITRPALLTVVKEIGEPRLPTLNGKRKARQVEVTVMGPADVGADPAKTGLSGSPTRVVKIFRPRISRQGRKVGAGDPEAVERAVDELIAFLEARNLI